MVENSIENKVKQAMKIIEERGRISLPMLQRRLWLGYRDASRIMDELETQGIVGPPRKNKYRKILKNSKAKKGSS